MILLEAGHLPERDLQMHVAALAANVLSFREGAFDAYLYDLAAGHAEYMARVDKQGHQNFDKRFKLITARYPGEAAYEIAAESWTWELDEPAGSKSMFDSWRQSPGHWAVADGPCARVAYAMFKGPRCWYGCGLVTRRGRSGTRVEDYAIPWR